MNPITSLKGLQFKSENLLFILINSSTYLGWETRLNGSLQRTIVLNILCHNFVGYESPGGLGVN